MGTKSSDRVPERVGWGGDVLRLQYLNEVEADMKSAHVASAFGQEVFAYDVRAMTAPPPAPSPQPSSGGRRAR
jgi:hypothetical protein